MECLAWGVLREGCWGAVPETPQAKGQRLNFQPSAAAERRGQARGRARARKADRGFLLVGVSTPCTRNRQPVRSRLATQQAAKEFLSHPGMGESIDLQTGDSVGTGGGLRINQRIFEPFQAQKSFVARCWLSAHILPTMRARPMMMPDVLSCQ